MDDAAPPMNSIKLPGGQGVTTLVVTWVECAIGLIFFGMRFYVAAFLNRCWRIDFWLASATLVINVLASVFLTVSIMYGLGVTINELAANNPELISKNQYYQWIFTTFAIVGIAVGKLVIISFILQIEGSANNKRKWILYGFAISNIAVNVSILPIIWTQCTPAKKIWDETAPGNCAGRMRNQYYGYFQGSFGCVLDLALAIYPILIFWNLQMQLHVKVGLMVLFGCGAVAAACSAVKTKELSTVATSDLTYALASLDIWASTEMWVIFIVSCVPSIRPLFIKAFNKVYSSKGRTFPSTHGYAQQSDAGRGTHARAYASKPNCSPDKSIPSATDNDSLEDILPGQKSGIMMTSQIVVKYSQDDVDGAPKEEDWKSIGHAV